MVTLITEATGAPGARFRRIAARVLLAGFAVITIVVVAAQFDPGRFVYVQPLRGATVVCVLICAVPLVVAGAVGLTWPRRERAEVLKACGVLGAATAIVAVIVAPFAYFVTGWLVDDEMDHRVTVVAVSPDGTYEVVSAMRHGDSGGYQILRAQGRDGVFSRSSDYPLALICDELVQVRFVGPDELKIVTRSIDEPGRQLEGRISVDPRTRSTADQFSNCAGDQT